MRESLLKSLVLGLSSFAVFILVSTIFLKISVNVIDVSKNFHTQKVAGLNTNNFVLNNPQKDAELRNIVGNNAQIGVDHKTGALSYLSISYTGGIFSAAASSPVSSEEAAATFNRNYATYMGISNPDTELKMLKKSTDQLGKTRIVYQQTYSNIPVFGAQTSLHLNVNNQVYSYEGNTVPNIQVNTQSVVTKNNALALTIMEYEKLNKTILDRSKLKSNLELVILNKNLFMNNGDSTSYLTWKVNIKIDPILNEVYFVDARNGNIVYHYSNIISAVNRSIYDCSYGDGLCYLDASLGIPAYIYGRSEGQPARGVTNQHNNPKNYADTDTTYDFMGDAYTYYLNILGRNGANGIGGSGDGSVNYPSDESTVFTFVNIVDNISDPICPNAQWDGVAIDVCYGFSKLDVVAHEFQHGVTQYSVPGGGLTYQDESGTLNEAFSDIFGLAVEYNQYGYNDTNNPSSTAWLQGEGLDPADTGGDWTRSLSNPSDYSYGPSLPYPDRFYSSSFYCGSQDNGGVHWNSTVFSHTAYLIAMGGSFNGCQITGVGRTKMQLILYRALTTHTLPSTDFYGMYYAINQSCSELVGQSGITQGDCDQVTNAMQATEIDQPGKCSGTPRETPQCVGNTPIPTTSVTPTVTATITPTVSITTTVTPTITVTPTLTPVILISSTVKLEYSTDNSGEIELAYVDTVGNPVTKSDGVTSSNGDTIIGTSLESSGDYSFYFKPKYYLSKVIRQTVSLGTNNINISGAFEPGDFNNDDTVNSIDYSIFVSNYGKSGLGDINDDGTVNSVDFSILFNKYGKGGDYLTDYPLGWIW